MVASNPVQNAMTNLLSKPPVLHCADSVELLPGRHTVLFQAVFGGSGIGCATIHKEIVVQAGKTYSATVHYKRGREISHSPYDMHGQPLFTTFERKSGLTSRKTECLGARKLWCQAGMPD